MSSFHKLSLGHLQAPHSIQWNSHFINYNRNGSLCLCTSGAWNAPVKKAGFGHDACRCLLNEEAVKHPCDCFSSIYFCHHPGHSPTRINGQTPQKKKERSIRKAPFCLGNGLRYQKTISFNQNHFSLDLSLEQLDPFFLKTHFTFRYAHNLKIDGSRAGKRWNCFNTKQWYFIFKLAK